MLLDLQKTGKSKLSNGGPLSDTICSGRPKYKKTSMRAVDVNDSIFIVNGIAPGYLEYASTYTSKVYLKIDPAKWMCNLYNRRVGNFNGWSLLFVGL